MTEYVIFVKLIKYQAKLDEHRGIAQLVERRSPKPWVVGSSPTAPAKIWMAVFGPHVHKITQKILKNACVAAIIMLI